MTYPATFEEPAGNPALRWGAVACAALLFIVLAWYLYSAFTGVTGVRVDEAPPVAVDILPPPPPPPPPPKALEKPPEPTDAPKPVPEPAAAPKPDAPAPMTMNADATAGPGSLAAGSGSGSGAPGGKGTCIGLNCGKGGGAGANDGVYRQYLRSVLQQAVYRDERSRRFASSAEFEIRISPAGAIEAVALKSSSGKPVDDETLQDILRKVRGLRPPPYSQRYPVMIRVSGRRQL